MPKAMPIEQALLDLHIPFRTSQDSDCCCVPPRYNCCSLCLFIADVCCSWLQDGASPLHLAAGCGHAAVVQLLLQKGADSNVRTHCMSMLFEQLLNTQQHVYPEQSVTPLLYLPTVCTCPSKPQTYVAFHQVSYHDSSNCCVMHCCLDAVSPV